MMKGRLFYIGTLVLLAFTLAGCGISKGYVYFEALKPAAVTWPEEVTRVGYLNRAPLSMNSFTRQNRRNLDRTGLRIVDTTIVNNLLKGFKEGRKSDEIGYLEEMVFLENRRYDTAGKDDLLSGIEKWKVFNDNRLDALISLEYYRLSLEKSPQYFDMEYFDYAEEITLFMEILWRIYLPDSIQPLDEYLVKDTLIYTNWGSAEPEEYMNSAKVLQQGSGIFGYEYGRRQVPKWNQVARVLFRGGSSEMRSAALLVDGGKWDEAAKLWESLLAEEEDYKNIARALHNLAIHEEINDNITVALQRSDSAMQTWDNEYIVSYNKELRKRKIQQDSLYLQLRIK